MIVLIALIGFEVFVVVLLLVYFILGIGFDVQGRYVLPFVVFLFIVVGHVLMWYQRSVLDRVGWVIVMGMLIFVGVVQFVSWWWNVRSCVVGRYGLLYFIFDT